MGRHKKNDSAVLVEIVNDFYTHESGGDPKKLKYSRLEQYAQTRGIQARWYDFQRDKAVVHRIRELCEQTDQEECQPVIPAYKSLDIEGLLRNCRTAEELKRKLYELDCYWKKTYEDAAGTMEQNRELSGKLSSYESEIHRLELEKTEMSDEITIAETRQKHLQEEVTYLRQMLREYLYPGIASKLLWESHLPVQNDSAIRPEAFPKLLEGEIPQPFTGIQQPVQKETDRQEQLLAAMRKQVSHNGE